MLLSHHYGFTQIPTYCVIFLCVEKAEDVEKHKVDQKHVEILIILLHFQVNMLNIK